MTESGMLARVVFDEAHSEAWTIRPELAREMQPAHPGDASYARAAAALAERDFVVEPHAEGPLTEEALAGAGVLVIAHPSDPRWEKTTGTGAPRLSAAELDAIEAFVAGGGGLIVLGETEQDKYGNNLNELLERFGLHLENDTVQDYEHNVSAPSWVLADLERGARGRGGDLLARVNAACLYRATTISCSNGAMVLARTHATASVPEAPLIVAATHGQGRVAVLADSDLFGDDCIDELDHRALWLNLCYWAAAPAGGSWPVLHERNGHGPEHAPAWARLRDETNALALLQAPDGSLLGDADPDAARAHVAAMAEAIEELVPRFPHNAEYLDRGGRGSARVGFRQAGLHPRARGVPPRADADRRDRAPGPVPDVQAERLARHVLRGADRARAVAGLDREARAQRLRQSEVRPGRARRRHARLRQRVRGAVPRDRVGRRPAGLELRGDLLRP